MVKLLQEKPACSNSDIESQLLEAAKNGDIDVVKVHVDTCTCTRVYVQCTCIPLPSSLFIQTAPHKLSCLCRSLAVFFFFHSETLHYSKRELPRHAGSFLHPSPLRGRVQSC